MLTLIVLGILSSIATEIVTAINAKLQNTVLKGDGAVILSLAIALPAAIIKESMAPGFNFASLGSWTNLVTNFSAVWGMSQIYFLLVAQKLGLDLPSAAQSVAVKPAAGVPAVAVASSSSGV